MSTTGHESEAVNVGGLKASLQKFKTDKLDAGLRAKSDKTATVSDVAFDSATGKLKKTINGTTTNVCDVVTSGFRITQDDANGIDVITAVGSATVTEDNTNGIDNFNF